MVNFLTCSLTHYSEFSFELKVVGKGQVELQNGDKRWAVCMIDGKGLSVERVKEKNKETKLRKSE